MYIDALVKRKEKKSNEIATIFAKMFKENYILRKSFEMRETIKNKDAETDLSDYIQSA